MYQQNNVPIIDSLIRFKKEVFVTSKVRETRGMRKLDKF